MYSDWAIVNAEVPLGGLETASLSYEPDLVALRKCLSDTDRVEGEYRKLKSHGMTQCTSSPMPPNSRSLAWRR